MKEGKNPFVKDKKEEKKPLITLFKMKNYFARFFLIVNFQTLVISGLAVISSSTLV